VDVGFPDLFYTMQVSLSNQIFHSGQRTSVPFYELHTVPSTSDFESTEHAGQPGESAVVGLLASHMSLASEPVNQFFRQNFGNFENIFYLPG
jgi:hypothetical protein